MTKITTIKQALDYVTKVRGSEIKEISKYKYVMMDDDSDIFWFESDQDLIDFANDVFYNQEEEAYGVKNVR